MRDEPVEAWKNKIKWYLENRYLKDLTGFTTLGILEEIQKL